MTGNIQSRSQLNQDNKVLEFYNYKKGGFFIEAGASNGVALSNTYILEKEYDWKGICVEPSPDVYKKLCNNRPNSICSNSAIYHSSDIILDFTIVGCLSGITSDLDPRRVNIIESKKTGTCNVTTISLLDLLDKNNAPSFIEYLSLDTEGSEYEILKSFDFNKYKFGLIHVEHNGIEPRRTNIRELLVSNDYIYLGKNAHDDMYRHSSVLPTS